MPQSPSIHSIDQRAAADDNARASTSTPRTPKATPSRPSALLTKSWTSASVLPSATSSRITVGANTSTAADASSSHSLPASNSSSASTRASTPLPQLSFRPSSPQLAPRDPESESLAGPSRADSDTDQASSHGAFNDAAQDEPEAVEAVGLTASSSVHALDLLHRVNDRAAADRASYTQSLRSRFSQLSVGRASTKYRSRSNSRDAPAASARALPPQFLESKQVDEDVVNEPSSPVEAQIEPLPESEQYPDRKYYILSSAGKPIYISHASLSRRKRRCAQRQRQQLSTANESDEEDEHSTTQVGVMQALISIFADEEADKLRFIRHGELLITFLLRAPLYLVCVSAWNEQPSTLRQHLEYLHLQVVSLVSASQLARLFARMPNFDLRRLLEGTEGIFDYMVNQLNANEGEADEGGQGAVTDWASCHQWWLQALQPIRITVPTLRDQLTAALQPPAAETPSRPKDLLYVLLVANGRVVTLLRPRKHSVHPVDLLLLTNTVMGSKAIKTSGGSEEAEIWLPFSMPKFAPQGFVHAYVKFLDPESWVRGAGAGGEGSTQEGKMTSSELAVIVVTGDKDAFATVSAWISSLVARPPDAGAADTASITSSSSRTKRSTSKSLKPTSDPAPLLPSWMTTFQRHTLALCRHLTDPGNVEHGSPRVSAYTCAELALPGLRHFVYRSNSTIQLTSPTLPHPYAADATARKRLFTLYALVHHCIHHPVPPSSPGETPTTPAAAPSTSVLDTAFGFGSASAKRPLLTADRRVKMQLVRTEHEQVLGWITSPFELYLCVHAHVSKSAIIAIANGLTKWIKANERDLFLVNAGSF
ncbi:related to MON1-required for fusion of cvt-vesicles and autophagosomes with the vacuole [Sporisorium reilianum f. sp. reilianum]|uniref:Vacuolar fusion protein MON1 n=1 Tax=Sporisorium reilianum f. sp. reilianum TaxID=72559 RepID=A0A2N8UFT7_9BASI|nr:related to MON1-required for fusion of cvt-vesicles and autophagosomes with the vacuole [Sporisorium reilianum f. sp. reilianum]